MRRSETGFPLPTRVLILVCTCLGIACSGRAPVPPPPEPDGQRAYANLIQQVEFGPRIPDSRSISHMRRWLLSELQKTTATVATQLWSMPNPYAEDDSTPIASALPDTLHFINLLAHFAPERSVRIVLGAHYDSRPWADQDSGAARDLPVPGANDGASGVAVLLEVAYALSTWDPGIGVDLVFFDGEDYGREGDLQYYLMGSRYFVSTMGAYRPQAMILVDMVGDADLRIPMEGNSLHYAPALTRLVQAVADSLQEDAFVAVPGDTLYDDHIPFLRAGIPAVDLIDFDYDAWHTRRDLPDRCSPESLESVSRVVLGTLHRWAQATAH
jgi:glutaminyl-peptide cyclotransferase